jgi:CHAD domain-containing protein
LVPAVRDGAVDAIHDARVATRRIRAALDLVSRHNPEPHLDEAAKMARRIARALGRVRDIDVSLDLLADLERRVPATAHAAALCRGHLLRQRTPARRALVRKVDSLRLDKLPSLLAGRLPGLEHVLAARARERAGDVIDAVHHASGVYFPKRAHAVRVSIKKLRYLLEFSAAPPEDALRVLRKSQQILGDAQDRQVVFETVEELAETAPDAELEPLLAQVEAESALLYECFLKRRSELLDLCKSLAAEPSVSRPRVLTGTVVMLAAVAAGSALRGSRLRRA